MKTIISGRITQQILEDADFLAGIVPTSFVHNGLANNRIKTDLPVEVDAICPKLPEIGEVQRNWTMCLQAEAVIIADGNEHLANCARRYNLPLYEV